MNNIWNKFLAEAEFDTSNLHPKNTLHSSFWKNEKLDSIVRARLLKIANDLITQLELGEFIDDIVLTGSIASYNWHNLSDIDLHITLDFSKIDENTELVKQFLDLKRMSWNKAHKIMIKGHEVEVYFQDINEKHQSLGLFSLKTGKWVKKAEKITGKLTESDVTKKVEKVELTAE